MCVCLSLRLSSQWFSRYPFQNWLLKDAILHIVCSYQELCKALASIQWLMYGKHCLVVKNGFSSSQSFFVSNLHDEHTEWIYILCYDSISNKLVGKILVHKWLDNPFNSGIYLCKQSHSFHFNRDFVYVIWHSNTFYEIYCNFNLRK